MGSCSSRRGDNMRRYGHSQQHVLPVTNHSRKLSIHMRIDCQTRHCSCRTKEGNLPNSVNKHSVLSTEDVQQVHLFKISCLSSLDFISFSIAQPSTTTAACTDTFQVGGAELAINKVPTICGDNNGQHSKGNKN